ncbi:MAG: bacillithiol biosynthesis cysteine-adding enzyme BshC [Thermoanaerobaculia bacterium]|nr:bacillithiol biosynthesis cysteine-adding enzyme BshC [Thermoanaerobaculia bacterium]
MPPLPTAYLLGQDRDLLAPLRFLDPDGAVEALAESATPMTDRTALAEALRVANDAYGHPRAEELARKLADPRTRVVVTGQQPGLWGGPLMTLSKAVAAVRWAQALENAGVPAVAVFWVATEDHDFAESSRVSFIAPTGPETLDLGEDPDPLLPVGMRTFGPPLVSAMERAEELLGSGAAEGIQTARAFYRPNARFGEAFSRLMVKIFADRAPLFLDAMLPELKQAQAPYLERLVEARAELDAAYADRDARIQDRGHPLQVTPQPGLSPLFLLHSTQDEIGDHVQRRRIEWRADEHFGLRGSEGTWSVTELLSTIRDNPSTVSPGVLARPALQDAVLGSTLLVLGPGELSYLAQAAPGYEALGIEPPWVTLRPQSMILDTRSSSWLQELGLPLTELLDSTPEEIVARRFSEDPVGPVREEIDRALATLREQVLMIDQTLEKPWKKTQDQVHRGLEIFGGKVRNAVANRHGVWLRRAEKLHQMLRPAGSLQERKISTLFFYARYGDALARSFLEDLDLDPRKLSVIHP